MKITRLLLLAFLSYSLGLESKPYIIGLLNNQLGNQMFEVAAAVSLALENDAEPVFPDLATKKQFNIQENFQHVFWRLNSANPQTPPEFVFSYHEIPYTKITYHPNMILSGLFHSEKFFHKHKKEILDLYKPHREIKSYLRKKYPSILDYPLSVAVHVRCYWPYHKSGYPDGQGVLPFQGFDWFIRAMRMFPDSALFVIFSDNIPLCRQHLTGLRKNIVFIHGEPAYNDLFLMSMCKHNIISNSSFSWWGAYLNQNPKKIVIGPKRWYEPGCGFDSRDIYPRGWKIMD